MAAANGTLTPPSLPLAPTSPSAAKRKLPETHAIVPNGASGPAQGQSANGNTHFLQAVLQDILAVLKRYDTSRETVHASCRHHQWGQWRSASDSAHGHIRVASLRIASMDI
jgi:hypothetical protein